MAKLIDGKKIASELKADLKRQVDDLVSKGITPGLAVIIVGHDSASEVYVKNKQRSCEEIGIHSDSYKLPGDASQEEMIALIEKLNQDDEVDGILVQLPLPKQISETAVSEAISPLKDVDVFSAGNFGRMMLGKYRYAPCTPEGVMELLKREGIGVAGKHCVIVGRSNIVGKPMALLLLEANATITICHSKTKDLGAITRQADVIVAAVGRENTITADMVKEGAVVIDVGMNRDQNGKLCGDVAFEEVEKKASYITPVPGGVGPMTTAMLLQNTVLSAQNRK